MYGCMHVCTYVRGAVKKFPDGGKKNIGLLYHLVEVVFFKVVSLGGYTTISEILRLLGTFLELYFLNGV
jgi:hypothetical protein